VLRLAVTTSTRDSGLLDLLTPVFEQQHNVRVDVIAVGTGKALKLGENGDVDAILVHARRAEEAFMKAGHGIRREGVMQNSFEVLGPTSDPADIRGRTAAEALRKIAAEKQRFVSRGDESGTHSRELLLWASAGGKPLWETYVESGQGMGASLVMADQMQAYVLTDRGTYLSFRDKIDLVPLVKSTDELLNTYSVIVVNPSKHPRINDDLAQSFVDFLIAEPAQRLIGDHRIDGEPLFQPLRLPKGK
jgi:tungstate transport system substrate-binding protein